MRTKTLKTFLGIAICSIIPVVAVAQAIGEPQNRRAAHRPTNRTTPTIDATPETAQPNTSQQVETLKTDTNLVTVPVITTDRNGLYIPDLKQDEFSVYEDAVQQKIAFFATVSAPFHVVLMLDTSASTQEKLGQIQRAAIAFSEQLQSADRVKVISFDDQVRDLNDFTNDRAELKAAILTTRSGRSTKLYDAFELALSAVRHIKGRKAIVVFTDGVDWHSDEATLNSTLRGLDEEGVIVYPIRYDTRQETERIARQEQVDQGSQLPTIDVIRQPPSGTTAPTFPSDDPSTVPTTGTRRKTGPLGLPLPSEILRRPPYPDPGPGGRLPPPDRLPPGTDPTGRHPDTGSDRMPRRGTSSRRDDSLSVMLDQLYLTADSYLNDLANKSGGRLLRADTLGLLPDAFAKISAELRTQYAIGYYPTNAVHNGQCRKIKVTSSRKNVFIRARPGYCALSGT
jgi:Mg-chelatase subunit ChlD